jgi:hypothetical protein
MPEILTESFCERCGTRYTFESARPKVRLKGVKVLSRGLKNFVLSDDTTMDEAMAAARSETDRESTAHQLDAFHKTFSFCMSCRQYTCPNCWNEVEARCQSCAPLPEAEVAPTAFPNLTTLTVSTTLVAQPNAATNGHGDDAAATEPATKAVDQTGSLLRRFRPGQSLDDELAAFERERFGAEAETIEPTAVESATIEGPTTTGEPDMATTAALAAEPEAAFEPIQPADAGHVLEPVAAELEVPLEPIAAEGEAEREPVQLEAVAEPEFIEVEREPEPVAAATAEPEPVAEPILAAEPEPVVEPEPEPLAAAAADIVEQPTWRISAPDVQGGPAAPLADAPAASTQPTMPSTPQVEPQWPARPQWPAAQASAGLPFLGRPAQPEGGVESLWDASNRELVTTPPTAGRSASGIRPCVSCGLSLSANARFCRRCGTLQSS